jgi:hypothetical protein
MSGADEMRSALRELDRVYAQHINQALALRSLRRHVNVDVVMGYLVEEAMGQAAGAIREWLVDLEFPEMYARRGDELQPNVTALALHGNSLGFDLTYQHAMDTGVRLGQMFIRKLTEVLPTRYPELALSYVLHRFEAYDLALKLDNHSFGRYWPVGTVFVDFVSGGDSPRVQDRISMTIRGLELYVGSAAGTISTLRQNGVG